MKVVKSDYTAIYKDEYGTHIIKCKILNTEDFLFQVYNKTKNIKLPCFKLKAGYWELFKQKESNWTTKDLSRQNLIWCYKVFLFNHLVMKFHE